MALGCVIHDDRVLLVQRRKPSVPEVDGRYEFPGGKVEFGETPIFTAQREVLEETGYSVEAGPMLPFPFVAVRATAGERLHVQALCFRCALRDEGVAWVSTAESNPASWVPLMEIDPDRMQTGTLSFLRHVAAMEGLPLGGHRQ